MSAESFRDPPLASDGFVQLGGSELFVREIGTGQAIVVLHGGPGFDHNYLLPEMDRLSGSFRLIYYDQRGRGRSGRGVLPEQVRIESEVADLEVIRRHFGLETIALLGHSWGGLLAAEYTAHYPGRVSHLILMNTAPLSHSDFLLLRRELAGRRAAGEGERMQTLASSAGYAQGDLQTDLQYYRIYFRPALRRAEQLEEIVNRLRVNVDAEGIVRSRVIGERLVSETWLSPEFDLLTQLTGIEVPTLVLHGDYDLIPLKCAANAARSIPGARLVVLPDCGHFSYMECSEQVCREITEFIRA